ncbi:MAG: hslO [Oscillospiraceae bacterium]|nr:hslO [Oscillospiraceae bacterium]
MSSLGKMVRAISKDGSVLAIAVDSTDIVNRIERIHRTSAVVTAGLGRLTTAASMMGSMLKGEKDSITLRMNGGGETGSLISVTDSSGNVKAYVANPIVELPLNKYGKLDVSGAVGKDGYLQVIKDLGLKEPYIGQVPIESGEIAEDITAYYAISEQVPTVCSLGVLVNPDLTVRAAGGFLVQLLPFADESCADIIEENIKSFSPISQLIDEGKTAEQIAMDLLKNLEPNVLDESDVEYKCDCGRNRVERALISLGAAELQKMIDEDDRTEVKCHFCNKKYRFNHQELDELIKRSK